MTRRPVEIIAAQQAGPDHQVLTLKGGADAYQRKPCPTCPWRVDAAGIFPPEAFVHSAPTSYDVPDAMALMAQGEEVGLFACHKIGEAKPAVCAGFLLRGAAHNLAVRFMRREFRGLHTGGHELHAGYREMAIANGVDPAHPALQPCRGNDEPAPVIRAARRRPRRAG